MFPDPPSIDAVTNCSDNGVLGPVVGVIGSMQANEIIKIAAIGKCMFFSFWFRVSIQITVTFCSITPIYDAIATW